MTMDDEHIVLAAELVLGTADASENERAQGLMASEPAFAALVANWERRLGELHVMVDAVEPAPGLFARIKAKLGATAQLAPTPEVRERVAALLKPAALPPTVEPPSADVPRFEPPPAQAPATQPAGSSRPDALLRSDGLRLPRPPLAPAPAFANPREPRARIQTLTARVRRWRDASLTFGTIAAALAALIVVIAARPDLLPQRFRPKPAERIVERVVEKPQESGRQVLAVLQRDSTMPAFVLSIDPVTWVLTARRFAAESPAGRSYELWLVPARASEPRSLGVVGVGPFTTVVGLRSFDPGLIAGATYAVSLEPEGGSQTGFPTGAVLWSGRLFEALPPPAAESPAPPAPPDTSSSPSSSAAPPDGAETITGSAGPGAPAGAGAPEEPAASASAPSGTASADAAAAPASPARPSDASQGEPAAQNPVPGTSAPATAAPATAFASPPASFQQAPAFTGTVPQPWPSFATPAQTAH